MILSVDNGATHNFISHEVVCKLGLEIDKGKSFRVMVSNGVTMRGKGVYRGVQINQEFFPFDLGRANVMLGITWLSSLRDVYANWRNLTMKFEIDGKRVVLQEDPSLIKSMVSLRAMLHSIQTS